MADEVELSPVFTFEGSLKARPVANGGAALGRQKGDRLIGLGFGGECEQPLQRFSRTRRGRLPHHKLINLTRVFGCVALEGRKGGLKLILAISAQYVEPQEFVR